jgi:hypothetical protein
MIGQALHDYLQGFMVALGSGTVIVCWRWLEPVRAAIAKDYKLRRELRSYRGYNIQGD